MSWAMLMKRPVLISLSVIYLCFMVYIWGRSRKISTQTTLIREIGNNWRLTELASTFPSVLQKESNESGKVSVQGAIELIATEARNSSIVIGIPSIKRPNGTVYLDKTLEYVVRKRGKFDNVVFVVHLAESDGEWRKKMTDLVKSKFSDEVDRGLIQIIHSPDGLYPDWDKEMKINLGDPRHQVQWRSKQNIDQAYLMTYALSLKPKYYLGIEDDVSAVDNYLLTIFQHAESASKKTDNIVFISYCKWGAIGKLFPAKILPIVSNYLKTSWNDKPLDWLYYDLKKSLPCPPSSTNCEGGAKATVLEYNEQLFDHMGNVSSLDKSVKS